jgi:hypothetical protein
VPSGDLWGVDISNSAGQIDLAQCGSQRILSRQLTTKPALVHHSGHHELHPHQAFVSYADTLQEDRRVLVQRYHRRDVAFKTVGVGRVGTFCAIGGSSCPMK